MKIIPVAKTIQKSAVKFQPKQVMKPAAPKVDLSCEEQGFFKFGDRVIPIVFPR